MTVEISEVRFGRSRPIWVVGILCPACGLMKLIQVSSKTCFLVACFWCWELIEVDLEGMNPGDVRQLKEYKQTPAFSLRMNQGGEKT